MFIAALEFMSRRSREMVLRTLLRTCLPWNQGSQWYMVKHLRRPVIVGPVSWQWILCTLLQILRCIMQTPDLAVSGARLPRIIWRVRRHQWCLITLLFLVC